ERNNVKIFDGIRGVAAMAVVLSHSFLMFIPSVHSGSMFDSKWQENLFNSPFTFFYKGGSAVSLFFVLSGLVLSLSCQKNNNEIRYIQASALKRYIRLGVPVAASVIICYFIMLLGFFPDKDSPAASMPLMTAFSFDGNIVSAIWDASFGAMLFGNIKYNYVLWTISIEFFGSILVYGFISLFGENKTILRWLSFISFVCMFLSGSINIIYYGLFLSGVFLSTFEISENNGRLRKLVSLLMLFIGLYLVGYAPASTAYKDLVEFYLYLQFQCDILIQWPEFTISLGSFLIIASVFVNGRCLRGMSKNVVLFIGRLSFSIYLLHPFVISIVGFWVYKNIASPSVGAFVTFILTSMITILISMPFYSYVDRKSIILASKFPEKLKLFAINYKRMVVGGRLDKAN
ncbi:acyltransferase, partial [Escherichia coli]|uniref:acyltransferase family protein n=10 Tax=Enterobacterales TaxID=91347 RepID=UPI001BD3C975